MVKTNHQDSIVSADVLPNRVIASITLQSKNNYGVKKANFESSQANGHLVQHANTFNYTARSIAAAITIITDYHVCKLLLCSETVVVLNAKQSDL